MVRMAVVLDVPGWSAEDVTRAMKDMEEAHPSKLGELYIPQLGAEVSARFETVTVVDDLEVFDPDAEPL